MQKPAGMRLIRSTMPKMELDDCAAGELSAPAAVSLLSDFAGRLEQPLRALL